MLNKPGTNDNEAIALLSSRLPKIIIAITKPIVTPEPPIVFGFLATGANVMGAVTQAILIVVSTVIYTPFLIAYEKYQNKQAAEA